MTKYATFLMLGLFAVGCGGPPPPDLWIASKGDELHIQLSPIEPNPF